MNESIECVINTQKGVADELQYQLEILDPFCILAGGAPRDWWLGKPCNDLDFYIHLPHGQCFADELRFKRLGLEVSRMGYAQKEHSHYGCMHDLSRIYEGVYNGVKFQVMVMNKPTFECVVDRFGTSVCMAWYKNNRVHYKGAFLASHLKKIIYIKDDYNAKEVHVSKMVNYFPDYQTAKFTSYEDRCTCDLYRHILCEHPQTLAETKQLLKGEIL